MRIYRIYKDDDYIGSSSNLSIIKKIAKKLQAEIIPLEIGGENVKCKKGLSNLSEDYDFTKLSKKGTGF